MADSQHQKGKAAEAVLNKVASISYSPLFCFANPEDPKTNKEICDLLIVCGNTALIWQVKSLKKKDSGTFKQGEVDKAIRQSRGARKTLSALEEIEFTNIEEEKVKVDFRKITRWHQVAAFVGADPDFLSFYNDSSDVGVHLFTDDFTFKIIAYLDTLNDLSDYLEAKEKLFHGNETGFTIVGGEENLLVQYLQNARSFTSLEKDLKGSTMAILDLEGMWDDFIKSDQFKSKLLADRRGAAGWDSLIRAAAEIPDSKDKAAQRRYIELMSSHSRMERRALGDAFYEGWVSLQEKSKGHTLRRISPTTVNSENVMYIFMWLGESGDSEHRLRVLQLLAIVARKEFPDYKTIVGIGAPQYMVQTTPYDFMLAELPDNVWNDELEKRAIEIQKDLGFLTNLKTKKVRTHEFPDIKK